MIWFLVPLPCWNPTCLSAISILVILPSFIRGWPGKLPQPTLKPTFESWLIAQPYSLLSLVLYILRAQLSLRVSLARCQWCSPVIQQVELQTPSICYQHMQLLSHPRCLSPIWVWWPITFYRGHRRIWSLVPLPCWNPTCLSAISILVFLSENLISQHSENLI